MNVMEAVERAGITYRQIDFWIRSGYVHVDGHGSGNKREVDDLEASVVRDMAALVRAGFRAEAAAHVARAGLEGAA